MQAHLVQLLSIKNQNSTSLQLSTDSVARQLKVVKGALIQAVSKGSQADKAGLLPTRRGLAGIIRGDVIVGIDETTIIRASDLVAALDSYNVGDTAALRVQRGDGRDAKELSLKLTLEEGSI